MMIDRLERRTAALDYPAYTPYELTTQFCVEDCIECVRACERAAYSCLRGMPLTWMVVYRKTLLESADLALRTAQAVAQDSPSAIELCDLCAETCRVLVRECEAIDSEPFRRCAEACRRCADSCQEVVAAA